MRDRAVRGITQGQAANKSYERYSAQWLTLSSLLPAGSQTHSLRTISSLGLPSLRLHNPCSKVSGSRSRGLSAQVRQASLELLSYAENSQTSEMKTCVLRSKPYSMRWSP